MSDEAPVTTAHDRPALPQVSVVIPLYNKASYIDRCLTSVRAQTMEDYELVIVDDGSTDGSPEMAQGYLREGDQFIAQPNAGPGPARNTGIAAARGEFVAFLDADDEWMPEFLEMVVGLFAKYPEARMAGCRFSHYSEYDNRGHRSQLVPVSPPVLADGQEDALLDDFFAACCVHGHTILNSSSVVVRREVFGIVGNFVAERLGEDIDMWGRIAIEYPVAYTDRLLSCYYRGIEGSTRLSNVRDDYPVIVRTALARLEAGTVPDQRRESLKRYCGWLVCAHAHSRLLAGQPARARAALRDARMLGVDNSYARRLRWMAALPGPVFRALRGFRERAFGHDGMRVMGGPE